MSGRTQKRAVSNSFPVSCLCSQKRYQLDIILLLMDGSSGMMCGIVSFIMQPSFCIQEWRETTQQTLGKRKFSCSSFRFSGKCINHILYIHLFIYYIFYHFYKCTKCPNKTPHKMCGVSFFTLCSGHIRHAGRHCSGRCSCSFILCNALFIFCSDVGFVI